VKCVICKTGETKAGTTTVTLERGDSIVIIRHVPAQVCTTCGEAYTDEDVTKELLATVDKEISAGVVIQVRDYHAA